MEQFKKIRLTIIIIVITCINSYSQDTTSTIQRKSYIIITENKEAVKDVEDRLPKNVKKATYTSVVESGIKKVIVSYLLEDGTVAKESYQLVEDKK